MGPHRSAHDLFGTDSIASVLRSALLSVLLILSLSISDLYDVRLLTRPFHTLDPIRIYYPLTSFLPSLVRPFEPSLPPSFLRTFERSLLLSALRTPIASFLPTLIA